MGSIAETSFHELSMAREDSFDSEHGELHMSLRPEFFYFSFYRPSRPNFLKIEKKKKFFFCQFYFCIFLQLMPVQYLSSDMFFRFDFATAARLFKLPPVTAPGEILPF